LLGAKEDITNKSSNIDTDKTSTTKYANVKAIYDWVVGKFIDSAKKVISWAATPSNDNIPSEKLVKDSLDLKADITPANGSTSALRALFTSVPNANCVYNTATGYYEMNGITDLTEAQLRAAYPIVFNGSDFRGLMRYVDIRTNFPVQVTSHTTDVKFNLSKFCIGSNIEVFAFWSVPALGNKVYVSSLANSFRYCNNLKKIIGVLDVSGVDNFYGSFFSIPAFEQIELLGLKANIEFVSSPLLNFYTLQYMVANRANGTTRITITVHATVWSKLNDAVNYPEWNALLVDAVANQYIDFASA